MPSNQELSIRITGSAKAFIDELDKAKKKTKDLEAGLAKTAKISGAAFVLLTTAVTASVLQFSKFEKGFTNVVTLLDKSSFKTKTLAQGIDSLKNGIIALSADSGESFEVLNQGLFDLVSNGVPAEKAISTLKAATELATAGATDTATAVKALTASLTSFGSEAGTAEEITQKFFTAQKFGSTTVGELATEFNKVAGTAKVLGLSFDETLASLSSLTANGTTPTTVAATQLKAAMNSLILVQAKLPKESAAIQDALDLENVKRRGLVKSFELLKTATGGSISEIQRLVGSSEALAVVNSLTGKQSELVALQIDEIGNASKRAATFQDALATKQETTDFALRRLKQSATAAVTVFGELFAPVINAAAQALSGLAKGLVSLDKGTIKIIAAFTGVGIALTALLLTVSVGGLAFLKLRRGFLAARAGAVEFGIGLKGLKLSIRGVVGATGIGLVLVALSIMAENFKETKAIAIGTFESIKRVLFNFGGAVQGILGGIGDLLVGIFTLDKEKIAAGIKELSRGVAGRFAELGKGAGDAFTNAYNQSLAASTADEALENGGGDGGGGGGGGGGEDSGAAKKKLAEEQARLKAEAEAKAAADAEDLARAKAKSDKEIEILREKKEAKDEITEEERLKKEEDRELDLEDERRHGENLAIVQEEIDLLSEEQQGLLNARDIKQFQDLNLSKDNLRRQLAKERIADNLKEKQQYLKDELIFGTAVAKINALLRNQDVQGTKDAANQLVQLTQSKNKQLKGIGKAAALTQIGIKTAEGAISAFSSLSGIPIVGPALGAVAAAALIAYGAEQASAVASAAQGGIVPNGLGGSRDRIPAILEPGELVVPKALAPDFIQAVGRPDSGAGSSGGGAMQVVVGFTDDAFEIIEEKLIERRRIDGVGLGALG